MTSRLCLSNGYIAVQFLRWGSLGVVQEGVGHVSSMMPHKGPQERCQ